jgi:hypothetical protein
VNSESPDSDRHAASHSTERFCCHTPFLPILKDSSLRIPEMCEHHFSCSWLRFELLFDRRNRAFPFHILSSGHRFIMLDPCFVSGDNGTQKGVTFLMIPAQRQLELSKRLRLFCFREMFRNPSCTSFIDVKAILDNFTGRLFCSWFATSSIVTLLFSRISRRICSMLRSVVDVDRYSYHTSSATATLDRWLLNMSIHLYTARCGKRKLSRYFDQPP